MTVLLLLVDDETELAGVQRKVMTVKGVTSMFRATTATSGPRELGDASFLAVGVVAN